MKKLSILLLLVLMTSVSFAQQDAQYTHYMYNTISVNPAYAGSRDVLSLTGLYRTQWVGLRGAPRNFTFSGHSPLKNEKLGLGVSLVRDEIWVQDETYLDIDFSYTINTSATAKLAFGLKAGAHLLNIDFSKANPEDNSDDSFDPGSAGLLDAYSEWRQVDQRKVVGFTDSLIRMFGVPGTAVSVGRGVGLAAFDVLPGAKQELARHTMGLAGRLSRLARGRSL